MTLEVSILCRKSPFCLLLSPPALKSDLDQAFPRMPHLPKSLNPTPLHSPCPVRAAQESCGFPQTV